MVVSIALKEFYNNLVSARFTIGFLLCLLLIPLTLVVNINDYRSKVTAYETQRKEAAERLKIRVWVYLRPRVVREPEPLSILSRGISYQLGNYVDLRLDRKPFKAEGSAGGRDNPLMSTYFTLDFCTVLAVLLSLLALLFTYDAINGEREQGTLKQLLANSIPRSSVLMGKLAGACLTLLPIILFCYLLCALIIQLSPDIAFSAVEWGRLALILLASILYFALFAFLGLLVSSLFRYSAASIIVCLLAWIFFLFVVPNLSGYVAESLLETPSAKAMILPLRQYHITSMSAARAGRMKKPPGEFAFEWDKRYADGGAHEYFGATADYLEWFRQGNREFYNYLIDRAEGRWQMEKEFLDKQDRQRLMAERLSMISPSQVFLLLCSSLCRTDVESYQRYMASAHRYREQIIRFFRDENLFDSYKFFTAVEPQDMMTIEELYDYCTEGRISTKEEIRQWRAKNVGAHPFRAFSRSWPEIDKESLPLLDLSIAPGYNGVPGSVAIALRDSMFKLAMLVMAGVVLFYLSFIAFLRYDVR